MDEKRPRIDEGVSQPTEVVTMVVTLILSLLIRSRFCLDVLNLNDQKLGTSASLLSEIGFPMQFLTISGQY
jgi:hypothetical protein